MKDLHNYIFEKLNIKDISVNNIKRQYNCCPKTKDELRNILKERLKENKNANLNDIDVSEITNMSYLFFNLDPHNIDIPEWNVSNVIRMRGMFYNCDSLKNIPSWYIK